MVFAANGATVANNRVYGAKFLHAERAAEGPAYLNWFRAAGFDTHDAQFVNEGEGDLLVAGSRLLAGTGFRTDPSGARRSGRGARSSCRHTRARRSALLPPRHCAVRARPRRNRLFPRRFQRREPGSTSRPLPQRDHRHRRGCRGAGAQRGKRRLPRRAPGGGGRAGRAVLLARGYQPVPVELSELRKAGGGPKCCTLELRA